MEVFALIVAILVPLATTIALLAMLGKQQKMIEALQTEIKLLKNSVKDLENVQMMLNDRVKESNPSPMTGLVPILGAVAATAKGGKLGPLGIVMLVIQLGTAYLKRRELKALPTKKEIGGQKNG